MDARLDLYRASREELMALVLRQRADRGVGARASYAAYTTYEGRHQYCWAHLLRDIDVLVDQHPDHAEVRGWADACPRPASAGQDGCRHSRPRSAPAAAAL